MTQSSEPDGPTRIARVEHLSVLQKSDRLIMTQVNGSNRGREFRVLSLQEALIGRGENVQIQLDEPGVSRFHAKISYARSEPTIEDLGSTNGVFVNRKRISHSRLMDGDTLQICSSEFKVQLVQNDSNLKVSAVDPQHMDKLTNKLRTVSRESDQPRKSLLNGTLASINLASLLQILHINGTSGTLVVKNPTIEGEVVMEAGQAVHARLGPFEGKKAFFRLMAIVEGDFDFFSPSRKPIPTSLTQSLQELLMEALVEQDEIPVYLADLPPAGESLCMNTQVAVFLHKFPSSVFEVLRAVSKFRTVPEIMEHVNIPDLQVCRILLLLLREQVLVPGESEAPQDLQTGEHLACKIDTLRLADGVEDV